MYCAVIAAGEPSSSTITSPSSAERASISSAIARRHRPRSSAGVSFQSTSALRAARIAASTSSLSAFGMRPQTSSVVGLTMSKWPEPCGSTHFPPMRMFRNVCMSVSPQPDCQIDGRDATAGVLRVPRGLHMTSLSWAARGALAAAAIGLLGPARAFALPDLVPEIYNLTVATSDVLAGDVVEGCAGGQFDRRLVKFSLRTYNVGPDDLILGDPGCPNCSLNPGAECANPLFECGAAHGHAHFGSFADSEILDQNDQLVATGHKYGFCLLDLACPNPHYSCSYQGITAGCSDVYSAGLPCQYIDITDDNLPDGVYKLRVRVNPDGLLTESDQSNNTVETFFTVGETEQVCPTYASSDVPKAIPDLATATSSISVPDIGEVTSLRLHMNGTHTFVSDLDATLTSPAATTRTLFQNICGAADNFGL